MSVLPDEMWRRVMEIGIETKILDYKNLCCLSIASRRLRRLASEDSIWSLLLLSDFPSTSDNKDRNISIGVSNSSTSNSKFKTLYKIRYEKDREKKLLAHRRAVLRIESEITEHLRRIQEIDYQLAEEKGKMNKASVELLKLRRIRQASVAVNVWQPEIIRGRQREMIQQNNVPIDFRINSLEMELNLCKQQIAGIDKAHVRCFLIKTCCKSNACGIFTFVLLQRGEKISLQTAKEKLASLKYNPIQNLDCSKGPLSECRIRSKKLKNTSTMKM